MAKLEDTEKETWGTWEELLLGCAVNRYGTKSWDSVAMEIQNRSPSPHHLTPQNCKQRYYDLQRRFVAKDDKINDEKDESETDHKKEKMIPWLDELRKLRVAELRREVQQYDVSIVSLQSKVNRLKEERDRSLREKENSVEKTDLKKERVEGEKKEGDREQEKSSPENVSGKPVSGEESDRENQSFNESNSTDPKGENRETGVEEAEKKPEPVETAGKPDPVPGDSPGDKPVGEGSYNGSSDTIAKDSAVPAVDKSSEAIRAREAGDSAELWESVAESKGGADEGMKESSDVQSSASLSRKNHRKKATSGSSSGEEPETDEISPAIKRISVKSQPLVGFLEIIRSHKYGSVFERRLESQETAKYRSLIRQHVDLETVQTRLEKGRYSNCSRKFLRDVLLLFNNAIVFFPKNSAESIAAIELRQLVSKEMACRIRKSNPPEEELTPPQTVPPTILPKPDPEPSDSLLVKPKSSGPMIACRKRSSISAKASSTVVDRKGEQKAAVIEEKPVPDRMQPDNSSANVVEEQSITKKRTRERPVLGARSSRTNSKNRKTTHTNKNSNQTPSTSLNPSLVVKGATSEDNLDSKMEKKNNTTTVAKKRSAANFLNRIKRNSSSSNGALLETLKSSMSNSNNGKGGGVVEQKKSGGRSEGRKDQVSRQNSSGKRGREQSSPAKRSVGRPPKRATAPPPLQPPTNGKRSAETVETEVVGSRQPRKRSRR